MEKQDDVKLAELIIEDYLADLEQIVNVDSGTYTKAGVDRVGDYLQERFRSFGFASYVEPQQEYGDNLVAIHRGSAPDGPRILLVGHMDTVFPEGEVARRPFAFGQR